MNSILAAVVVNSSRDGYNVQTFFVDESVEDFVKHLESVYGVARDVDVVLLEEGRYGDHPHHMILTHVGACQKPTDYAEEVGNATFTND